MQDLFKWTFETRSIGYQLRHDVIYIDENVTHPFNFQARTRRDPARNPAPASGMVSFFTQTAQPMRIVDTQHRYRTVIIATFTDESACISCVSD